MEKRANCHTCKHNMTKSSCGPCADKGSEMIKNIAEGLNMESENTQESEIMTLKSSCKIILQYPEEYDNINPFKCKFYLPSAFNFY